MTGLPDAATLHAMARNKNAAPPAAITAAVENVERTERMRSIAVAERDDLIRQARAVGVPWTALARWFGLSQRRLDQIVNDR